jgi:hypothetical protein
MQQTAKNYDPCKLSRGRKQIQFFRRLYQYLFIPPPPPPIISYFMSGEVLNAEMKRRQTGSVSAGVTRIL